MDSVLNGKDAYLTVRNPKKISIGFQDWPNEAENIDP